jgi:hypothetical protein
MNQPDAAPHSFDAWRQEAGPEPDFADLGTAFGLDLSLTELIAQGLGCDEAPRRHSDEGLEGADDPCRAWVR